MTRARSIACLVATAGAAFLIFGVPALIGVSTLLNLTIYVPFALLGLSLSLVWGAGGILSLGQAAFFGLGGYAYAVAAIDSGNPYLAVAVATLVPTLFAALFGYFMFWGKVSDVYLAVMSLTVTQIFQHFVNQTGGEKWHIGAALLGGFNGIPDVPLLDWPLGSGEAMSPQALYGVAMATLIAAYLACRGLIASRFGRVLIATRENETRCDLLGYDVRLYKQAAFMISGGLAGLAGALFANAVIVSPQMFALTVSAQIIICVIVGGASSLSGAVVGSFLIQGLTTWLGSVSQRPGFHWIDPDIGLGLLLVVFVIFAPRGIVPLVVQTSARHATRMLQQVSRWADTGFYLGRDA